MLTRVKVTAALLVTHLLIWAAGPPHTPCITQFLPGEINKGRASWLKVSVSVWHSLPVWQPLSCGNLADQVCGRRREKQAVATSPGSLHMSRPDLSHCCCQSGATRHIGGSAEWQQFLISHSPIEICRDCELWRCKIKEIFPRLIIPLQGVHISHRVTRGLCHGISTRVALLQTITRAEYLECLFHFLYKEILSSY